MVNFWKIRQPGESIPELPLLPMSDSEKARFGATRFSKPGLHVGVVAGCGAEGILEFLKTQADLDAQPVYNVTPENLEDCQVLIVPQLRLAESFTA